MQHTPQSTTFNGLANHGSQIGHSSGSVTNHFYVGPTRKRHLIRSLRCSYEYCANQRSDISPDQPLTPALQIPFRRDRDFVERHLLTEIWQRATQPAARVGLIGLGGVG